MRLAYWAGFLLTAWQVHAAIRTNFCKGFPMAISITKNIGMLLLAIWLILTGVIPLLSLGFAELGTIMAILAIVAGVFILLGR